MPKLGPIKRKDLIRYLVELGFNGPFPGRKHAVMRRGAYKLTLPNPHVSDIGEGLLRKLLREAGISTKEWEAL